MENSIVIAKMPMQVSIVTIQHFKRYLYSVHAMFRLIIVPWKFLDTLCLSTRSTKAINVRLLAKNNQNTHLVRTISAAILRC